MSIKIRTEKINNDNFPALYRDEDNSLCVVVKPCDNLFAVSLVENRYYEFSDISVFNNSGFTKVTDQKIILTQE